MVTLSKLAQRPLIAHQTAINRLLPIALALGLSMGGAGASARPSAADLATKAGWRWDVIQAGNFDLDAATKPVSGRADVLTIYIEGDGLAYVSPGRRAMDPTPTDPVALKLALRHPGPGAVAYLARPCQYNPKGRNCRSDYWTVARYAPEVVDSANAALDQLKAQVPGASRLILVGYSGGGALAALLAERRSDIAGLVTVAANLDLATWLKAHQLTPLNGSMDPAADAARLSHLPQVHLVGARDPVVGVEVTNAFRARLPADAPVSIIVEPGQDHGCCWALNWAALAQTPELTRIPGWR